MYRNLALFFAPFSRLSWSLTQAYLYLREFLVSYGTGNILPTLFPKVALGPSNSTFLLVFHTLTVSDTASASPLIIELPLKGRIVIIKIMKKNKGNRACFCCCPPPAFLAIFEGGLGRVLKRHVRGRWKKALKNSTLWNLPRDKAIRT